eukprot:m.107125 g.107125  ORF g.107125 m.107125 type:complete len:1647 (+) comp13914_c0_seq1:199-5139(+)
MGSGSSRQGGPPPKIGKWRMARDDHGREFFWHVDSRETQWDRPDAYGHWFPSSHGIIRPDMFLTNSDQPNSNDSTAIPSMSGELQEAFEFTKSPVVSISRTAYTPNFLVVAENQTITWHWTDSPIPQNVRMVSVLEDGLVVPVPGGLDSDLDAGDDEYAPLQTFFSGSIGVAGVYYFASDACQEKPMKVIVQPKPWEVDIRYNGFSTEFLVVDRGDTVKFDWTAAGKEIKFYEVLENGAILKERGYGTTYTHRFTNAGSRTYTTGNEGHNQVCTILTRQGIMASYVSLAKCLSGGSLAYVAAGDTVVFDTCLTGKFGCFREIEPDRNESGKKKANGIDTQEIADSTGQLPGMIFHKYTNNEIGPHYYEFDGQSAATIVVLPSIIGHSAAIRRETDGSFAMHPSILYVKRGEACEWTWATKSMLREGPVQLTLHQGLLNENIAGSDPDGSFSEISETDSTVTNVQQWHQFEAVGSFACSIRGLYVGTVVVRENPMHHIVTVADEEFVPPMVTCNPGDSIVWQWLKCRTQHEINQISYTGSVLPVGNVSPCGTTGAFSATLNSSGVFYYKSTGHAALCSVVIVKQQPESHVLAVDDESCWNNPGLHALVAHRDDLITWTADGVCENPPVTIARVRADGDPLDNTDMALLNIKTQSFEVVKEKPVSFRLTRPGALHFRVDNNAVRTIIVDDRLPAATEVVVAEDGSFFPAHITLEVNSTVCWSWRGVGNRRRVYECDTNGDDVQTGFDSKLATGNEDTDPDAPNPQMVFTFTAAATRFAACEQSQPMPPSKRLTILIQENVECVGEIHLFSINKNRRIGPDDTLSLGEELMLQCETPNAEIYYTIDGTAPSMFASTRFIPGVTRIYVESWMPFVRAYGYLKGFGPRNFISHRLVEPNFRQTLIGAALLLQSFYRRYLRRKKKRLEAANATQSESGTLSVESTPNQHPMKPEEAIKTEEKSQGEEETGERSNENLPEVAQPKEKEQKIENIEQEAENETVDVSVATGEGEAAGNENIDGKEKQTENQESILTKSEEENSNAINTSDGKKELMEEGYGKEALNASDEKEEEGQKLDSKKGGEVDGDGEKEANIQDAKPKESYMLEVDHKNEDEVDQDYEENSEGNNDKREDNADNSKDADSDDNSERQSSKVSDTGEKESAEEDPDNANHNDRKDKTPEDEHVTENENDHKDSEKKDNSSMSEQQESTEHEVANVENVENVGIIQKNPENETLSEKSEKHVRILADDNEIRPNKGLESPRPKSAKFRSREKPVTSIGEREPMNPRLTVENLRTQTKTKHSSRVKELLDERAAAELQVMIKLESMSTKLKCKDLARDTQLTKLVKKALRLTKQLNTEIKALEESKDLPHTFHITWQLNEAWADDIHKISLYLQDSLVDTYFPSDREARLEITPEVKQDKEYDIYLEIEGSFGKETVTTSIKTDMQEPPSIHSVCSPVCCKPEAFCRFEDMLQEEIKACENTSLAKKSEAYLRRQPRVGMAFPLREEVLGVQWIASKVTLLFFWLPWCTPCKMGLGLVSRVMNKVNESVASASRTTTSMSAAKCILVTGGWSKDEATDFLSKEGYNNIPNTSLCVVQDLHSFQALLKNAHIHAVPNLSVVGITGNLRWSRSLSSFRLADHEDDLINRLEAILS